MANRSLSSIVRSNVPVNAISEDPNTDNLQKSARAHTAPHFSPQTTTGRQFNDIAEIVKRTLSMKSIPWPRSSRLSNQALGKSDFTNFEIDFSDITLGPVPAWTAC